MKRWRLMAAGAGGALAAVALAAAVYVQSLGPAPLGRELDTSHVVLDRDGKLLRAYATPEGRWRLPATVEDVDPRFLKLLFAYEDKRFYAHHGVDPFALGRAAFQLVDQRPYRLGRLDPHHAGGAAARAARAPHRSAPSCARWCARSSSSTRSARTRSSRSI